MNENKQFLNIRNLLTNPSKYIDFDISAILRDAVGSDMWKNKKGLWTAISGACNLYSKLIFTKILNLTQNITDIDSCNIHALKSIAKSVKALHLTDFIIEDYPLQILKLINLFSVNKDIIFNSNAFISLYATYNGIGTIDNRNKDIFNDLGYSKILFYEILLHLDLIKYLLEVENGINLNYSIWNYLNIRNRNIKYRSILNCILLNESDLLYTAPSINKIFNELYYLKNLYAKKYDILKNKILLDNTKYSIYYCLNFNEKYFGTKVLKLISKDFIIEKCTHVHKYKDFKFIKELDLHKDSYKNYENEILFGWNPYDEVVINNSLKYKLYNNFNISALTLFINPFLVLIAIFKNIIFNAQNNLRMTLFYIDEKTNEKIDLSFLILNCVQSIQHDHQSYINLMMIFHFYGLFYDMIINLYLKKLWNTYVDDGLVKSKYIGTYSEYTQEEFLSRIPKYIKNSSIILFIKNGPAYYNQYHLDFLIYLTLINNNIIDIGETPFSYIISNYNNDFSISDIKNSIYNSEKRRLLGYLTSIKYINALSESSNQKNEIYFNVDKSIIYYVSKKFADYCEKIRLVRLSIKLLIQVYAKIGTTQLIETIVKLYFYKEFKKYDKDTTGFNILLILYYDKTNYMNILAQMPKKIVSYIDGNPITSLVLLSGRTPSSYVTEFILDKDVLSTINTDINIFDTIILYSGGPLQTYCKLIAAVSAITLVYNKTEKTVYCFCTYYNTNGYTNDLSSHWTTSNLPQTSSIVTLTYPEEIQEDSISYTAFEILNKNIPLSSIYLPLSAEYQLLLNSISNKGIDIDLNNICLSSLTVVENAVIIPSGTLVAKHRTDKIDYTYNAIITSNIEKIPVYLNEEITGSYNYRYWDTNIISNENINDIFLKQITFWLNYFPALKTAVSTLSKKIIYQKLIYPFLSSILNIHYTSGFSGELSGLQERYIGNLYGNKKMENITNSIFPSIASFPNIANLILKDLLSKLHNLYINLYLNTFYSNLSLYSENVMNAVLDGILKLNNTLFGQPTSAWYYCYTTFTGYNSVYGQDININLHSFSPNKHINVDGPWIYNNLQYYVKLYYNSFINTELFDNVGYDFESLSGPLDLSNPIYLQRKEDSYKKIPIYYITYGQIYDFLLTNEKIIYTVDLIKILALKLFVYQKNIILASKYSIYNYKEDIYLNAITLFKKNDNKQFEDCGLIWLRKKNSSFSYPITLCRLINELLNYYEDNIDIIKCKLHNRYANIIKQISNNALDFGIYDNKIWILGKTNYINQNNRFIKQNNLYLTLCVFEYLRSNDVYSYLVILDSFKFISFKRDISYITNINNFVTAYNNYKEKTIDFILCDMTNLNLLLTLKYKQLIKDNIDLDIIDQYLHLDNINLLLTKISYSIDDYSLSNERIYIKDTKYPIIGLFNKDQLINMKKYKEKHLNNVDFEDYIKEACKLIKKESLIQPSFTNIEIIKAKIQKEKIINYICDTAINYLYEDKINYNETKLNYIDTKLNSVKNRLEKALKIDLSLHNQLAFIKDVVEDLYDNHTSILDELSNAYWNKLAYFRYLIKYFALSESLFEYSYEYKLILDFIGYTLEVYKMPLINEIMSDETKYFSLFHLKKIKEAVITYNRLYNSIDIIFDKISNTDNKDLHKLCSQEQRNIISYFIDPDTKIPDTSIIFDNKIIIKDTLTDYFKIKNSDYVFKFVPYMQCNCNSYHKNLNNTLLLNPFNSGFNNTEKRYIKNLAKLLIPEKTNIYIHEAIIKLNFNILDYLYYNYIQNKNIDLHIYLRFIFDDNNIGRYYYVAFYILNNTVKYKVLGLKKYFHKADCNNNFIFNTNTHVWKANLNKNNLYIGYESINTEISNPSLFYKNLYYNELDLLYIDTITFEANFIRKQISETVYANIVQDITIKYGYDIIELPFTFRLLSALMLPELQYEINLGILTYDYKQQNILFILNYGNELNTIHNNYPKCLITGNKLKCTTIISKLGGIKDFAKNISSDKSSLLFLINYILYSSYRKKQKNISDQITLTVFDQLLLTTSLYCINSFLFNLLQVKTLFGNQYFDYDLLAGFTSIVNEITKSNLIKNKDNLLILNKSVILYLKNTEIYIQQKESVEKMFSNEKLILLYLLYLAALSADVNDILDKGFTFKFYNTTELYKYGNKHLTTYLLYLHAMPSFGLCFNLNLKINVNFGLLDYRVKNFITGLLSFDLDIACYIDDACINGQLHMKKVGWNCGYIKTDYINWLSNDNRFGGPLILECNLSKYNNTLYNKYVSLEQIPLAKYKYQEYNLIAKNINIHLLVCWYNESILISLNPYVDIYWKGLYKQIKVDKTKLTKNRKCCLNSWSYDIGIDFRNMIFNYKDNNTLYPVLTTLLEKKYLYKIYYQYIGSTLIINQCLNYENLLKTSLQISHSLQELIENYSTYNIKLKSIFNYCNRQLTDEQRNLIYAKYLDLLSGISTYMKIQLISDIAINYNKLTRLNIDYKTKYYNLLNLLLEQKNNCIFNNDISDFIKNKIRNIEAYDGALLYDIIENLIVNKNNFITILLELYNLNDINYFDYIYLYLNTLVELKDIYNKYYEYITEKFIIESYISYLPSLFYYYFTNVNIENELNKIKTNYYYPDFPMLLEILSDIKRGALHMIKTDSPILSDNYKLINLSLASGFILFLLYKDKSVNRNIIITDLKRLLKTTDLFLMTIENYNTITSNLQKYLALTLIIDTEDGLVNIYNSLIMTSNYIPDPHAIITPYLRYFISTRSIYLNKLPAKYFKDNTLYIKTGYYFDNNTEYSNIKYNVLTNNYNISFNSNIELFIFQTDHLHNYLLEIKNLFEIASLLLYTIYKETSTLLINILNNKNKTNIAKKKMNLALEVKNENLQSYEKLLFDIKLSNRPTKTINLALIEYTDLIKINFENILLSLLLKYNNKCIIININIENIDSNTLSYLTNYIENFKLILLNIKLIIINIKADITTIIYNKFALLKEYLDSIDTLNIDTLNIGVTYEINAYNMRHVSINYIPKDIYKYDIYLANTTKNIIFDEDRIQDYTIEVDESTPTILNIETKCRVSVTLYYYGDCKSIIKDIGYNFLLNDIDNKLISNLKCKLYNKDEQLIVTTDSISINEFIDRSTYLNEILNYANTDYTYKLLIPTKDNIGILKLEIEPYYKMKYHNYTLNKKNIIISNYYNLFKISVPSSLILYESNRIPLVTTVFNNLPIYYNINLILNLDISKHNCLRFESNNIKYPLHLFTTTKKSDEATTDQTYNNNYIISGTGTKRLDFIYEISAYYKTYNSAYYIGSITGYYFFKLLLVINKFKLNKQEFIFTPNMSELLIELELLLKNIVSTYISIVPSNNIAININDKSYKDIDFMTNNLTNSSIIIKAK